MKVVKVYGALRKRLGQCRFEFDVATPAQAIKALCVNFPGLDKWLIDSEKDGVGYRVAVSKEKVTEQDMSPLFMPFSEKEVFSITPVIAGAGEALAQSCLGLALIAASILFQVVCQFWHYLRQNFLALDLQAAACFLGGIAQAISPQPGPTGQRAWKEAVQLESFAFQQRCQYTAKQGMPCTNSLWAGVRWIGSAVQRS